MRDRVLESCEKLISDGNSCEHLCCNSILLTFHSKFKVASEMAHGNISFPDVIICRQEQGEDKLCGNQEIKEAIKQLKEMSADEYERELYEIRERSRLTYNTEMNEARRKGLEEGEKREKEKIAKKMKSEGLDIELIKKITNLKEEEINLL